LVAVMLDVCYLNTVVGNGIIDNLAIIIRNAPMKLQEMIVPLALAFLATILLQLFWSYRQAPSESAEKSRSGQRFDVVTKIDPLMQKALQVEVDFDDVQIERPEETVVIETDLARYHLSNNGAVITRLDYKSVWSDAHKEFTTINRPGQELREAGAFLVGLSEKTPYYYTLVSHVDQDGTHVLVYEAKNQDVTVRKQFTINKATYLIDLAVTIIPLRSDITVSPRVIFPAPAVKGADKDDAVTGITSDEHASLSIVPAKGETFSSFWLKPEIFGAQDKYFVNTLVKDPDGFTQRGYFTSMQSSLLALLEGPRVTQEATWNLQFYFGPKEESIMATVDPRLEQTLQYGWFSFITKPVSKITLTTLNAIYK
jgi:hypothetical protein